MSYTYYYNGDKLFGEAKTLRMVQNTTEIFFRHLGEMVTNFKKELMSKYGSDDEVVGNVDIDFVEDDYGIHKQRYQKEKLECGTIVTDLLYISHYVYLIWVFTLIEDIFMVEKLIQD